MMMIHQHQHHQYQHPTVEIPPWDPHYDDPTATPIFSPQTHDYFTALQRYLPSSNSAELYENDSVGSTESSSEFDAFSCDNFRMFEFKIRKCARGRSHDWTECPYAHPGEKARRRDPRKYHYSGTPCPEFRRGSCRKLDSCEFAHGVFECWLHPARYRTQPCKDGPHCKRRVCFFAHSPEQIRVLANSDDSPPSQLGADSDFFMSQLGGDSGFPASRIGSDTFLLSPELVRVDSGSPASRLGCDSVFVVSPESDSPPMSPSYGLAGAMRGLQIGKMGMSPSPRSAFGFGSGSGFGFGSPRSPTMGYNNMSGSGSGVCGSGSGFGSPKSPTTAYNLSASGSSFGSPRSPTGYMSGSGSGGCGSVPLTPISRTPITRSGLGLFDPWDVTVQEEPFMERVESGKGIRARMYAKLSKENSLGRDRVESVSNGPDFGWVSELVK